MRYRWTVTTLHWIVAVGALYGGAQMVMQPDGVSVGARLMLLRYSPFEDFLIPGLLLFGVIGLGNALAGGLVIFRGAFAPAASFAACGALIVWIVAQIYLLQLIHWLHLVYLALGTLILVLSWTDARAWLRDRR